MNYTYSVSLFQHWILTLKSSVILWSLLEIVFAVMISINS